MHTITSRYTISVQSPTTATMAIDLDVYADVLRLNFIYFLKTFTAVLIICHVAAHIEEILTVLVNIINDALQSIAEVLLYLGYWGTMGIILLVGSFCIAYTAIKYG